MDNACRRFAKEFRFRLFILPLHHPPDALRRSRDLPRHTPLQASNDVQCHVGEGHPGNMEKVHG
jgi:hypothetical protein